MIYESSFWKEPLVKSAKKIKNEIIEGNDYDSFEKLLGILERDIFVGFFSIRKLLESHLKLSDYIKIGKLRIKKFDKKKNIDPINIENFMDAQQYYDFSNPKYEDRDLSFISNQFIHSFIVFYGVEDVLNYNYENENSKYTGVYLVSDKDKNKHIYYIPFEHIRKIFLIVGRDYAAFNRKSYDHSTGRYVYNNGFGDADKLRNDLAKMR